MACERGRAAFPTLPLFFSPLSFFFSTMLSHSSLELQDQYPFPRGHEITNDALPPPSSPPLLSRIERSGNLRKQDNPVIFPLLSFFLPLPPLAGGEQLSGYAPSADDRPRVTCTLPPASPLFSSRSSPASARVDGDPSGGGELGIGDGRRLLFFLFSPPLRCRTPSRARERFSRPPKTRECRAACACCIDPPLPYRGVGDLDGYLPRSFRIGHLHDIENVRSPSPFFLDIRN